MVLLGDIVGEDDAMVAAATSQVVRIANARSGEGFIAVSAEARRKFWLDRARTAAIAKHTNAFKINEDVVIPLERLGEYTDAIERINIELSIRNKLELLAALDEYFSGEIKAGKTADVDAGPPGGGPRIAGARSRALAIPAAAPWMNRTGATRGDRVRPVAGPQHPGKLEDRGARELGAHFRGCGIRLGARRVRRGA